MRILHNDDMLAFLQNSEDGNTCRAALESFATTFLKGFKAMQEGAYQTVMDEHGDLLSPVHEAYQRIACFCRCMIHLYMIPGDVKTSDSDVMVFFKYAGEYPFEGTVRSLFNDESKWWLGEINDMIKMGGSSRLAEPKLESLKDLLQSSSFTNGPESLKKIREMNDLMAQVVASMRQASYAVTKACFLTKIQEIAKDFLEDRFSGSGLSSAYVDAILEGLARFDMEPGLTDMHTQVREHMAKKIKAIKGQDLITIMEKESLELHHFAEIKACLTYLPKREDLPPQWTSDDTTVPDNFLLVGLRSLCMQAVQKRSCFHAKPLSSYQAYHFS